MNSTATADSGERMIVAPGQSHEHVHVLVSKSGALHIVRRHRNLVDGTTERRVTSGATEQRAAAALQMTRIGFRAAVDTCLAAFEFARQGNVKVCPASDCRPYGDDPPDDVVAYRCYFASATPSHDPYSDGLVIEQLTDERYHVILGGTDDYVGTLAECEVRLEEFKHELDGEQFDPTPRSSTDLHSITDAPICTDPGCNHTQRCPLHQKQTTQPAEHSDEWLRAVTQSIEARLALHYGERWHACFSQEVQQELVDAQVLHLLMAQALDKYAPAQQLVEAVRSALRGIGS